MKARVAKREWTIYASEAHPEIETESKELGDVIAWADAHPTAWKIVTGTRSAPFGRESSTYMGFQRGPSPQAALARVTTLMKQAKAVDGSSDSIFSWRARFTLEHYGDNGFKGGFFVQHDGQYERGSLDLDFTPETLDEVVQRYVSWCGGHFDIKEVLIKDAKYKVLKRISFKDGWL